MRNFIQTMLSFPLLAGMFLTAAIIIVVILDVKIARTKQHKYTNQTNQTVITTLCPNCNENIMIKVESCKK